MALLIGYLVWVDKTVWSVPFRDKRDIGQRVGPFHICFTVYAWRDEADVNGLRGSFARGLDFVRTAISSWRIWYNTRQ